MCGEGIGATKQKRRGGGKILFRFNKREKGERRMCKLKRGENSFVFVKTEQ